MIHTTEATHLFPEINWQRMDLEENNFPMKTYNANGESSDGRKWIGNWVDWGMDEIDIGNIEEAHIDTSKLFPKLDWDWTNIRTK